MFAVVTGAVGYLTAMGTAGAQAGMMKDMANDRVDNIISMLGKCDAIIEDCTKAINLIGTVCVFDVEQKAKLLSAFHTRMQTSRVVDVDDRGISTKAQRNTFLEFYLTAQVWDKLLDNTSNEYARVDCIVDHLQCVLGIKFPDVETRKRVTAIVHVANDNTRDAFALKATYDLFASTNCRKRKLRQHTLCKMTLYPIDPKAFLALNPGAFPDATPPVPSRFASSIIDDLASMVPARGTNFLLKKRHTLMTQQQQQPTIVPTGTGIDMGNTGMSQHMQMFQSMMGMFQSMQHGQVPSLTVHTNRASREPRSLGDAEPDDRDEALPQHTGASHIASSARALMDCPQTEVPATPTREEMEDDIDKMMGRSVQHGPNQADSPPKTAKSGKRPAAKASAKKAGIVKSHITKPSSAIIEHPKNKPPKFGAAFPLVYNGCKVYKSLDRLRVVPFPGQSVYDRQYAADDEHWTELIKYCQKPFIPTTSKNHIKT